ncbi:MAG TPA: hypothetical protein VF773_11535 [Verrucomicrobiae bacterium]
MSWKFLSFHFKQSFDGGYRYLDQCGEFMVRAQQEYNFIPSEAKPSGAKLELPEQGVLLFADTVAIGLTQELNPDSDSFGEICVASSTLAREIFQPISVTRNGFAVKLRRDFSTEAALESALQQMVNEPHRKLAKIVGMAPNHRNLDYWFSAGSRQLHLTLNVSSLKRSGPPQMRPSPIAPRLEKDRFARKERYYETYREELYYALVVEADLLEDNPAIDANLLEHFAEARRIAEIAKEQLMLS